MPVLPPITAQVYDSVNDVLNTSRVRLNDQISSLQAVSGKLLENNIDFTQQIVNTGWRKYQEFLANIGISRLKQEAIIAQLPPVASLDPSSQVRIDWFNYFDGANLFQAPVLPPDLMIPLKLWERQSGTASAFVPMEMMVDGLPNWNKQTRNGCWEWRADSIYMPGALATTDLRILYKAFLADFRDSGNVQWFQQRVPIARCLDSFSYFICAEIADGREDMDPMSFRAKGEAAAKLLANRDSSMKQRTNLRRQSRSGRLEGSGNSDYGKCY